MASELAYELRSKYLSRSEELYREEMTVSSLQSKIEMFNTFLRMFNSVPDTSFFSMLINHEDASSQDSDFPVTTNDASISAMFTATTKMINRLNWFKSLLTTLGLYEYDKPTLTVNDLSLKVSDELIVTQRKLVEHQKSVSHHKEVLADITARGLCTKCRGKGSWYNASLAEGDPYARSSDCQEPCEPCNRTGIVPIPLNT